jgi:hypothetical protein
MRVVLICLVCLVAGACSLVSDLPPLEVQPQPAEAQLQSGLEASVKDSHFAQPIEVTDLLRSPVSYMEPWMVCIRGASSDQARRPIYATFYGTNANGVAGQYVKSRYSVIADNCEAQTYHPYLAPAVPSPSPSPSPVAEPKTHHKHVG